MNKALHVFVVLVLAELKVETARILALQASSAPSHLKVMQTILRTIAEAGHEVVSYSTRPLENPPPKYQDHSLISEKNEHSNPYAGSEHLLQLLHGSPWNCFQNMFILRERNMARILENEDIKRLLKSNDHFDLVITEPFLAQEFTFIFGYKFNAPVIGVQTFVTTTFVNLYTGNAISAASLPQPCFAHSDIMTFPQRIVNVLFIARATFDYYHRYLPLVDEKLRVYFPEMPPFQAMMNISLMFVNDHLTADYAQPRPWTLVTVAGIHIEPEKPLPQEIKEFMDGADNGVILFSLGSLIPDDMRPDVFFGGLVNTFRNVTQRVIWKTRRENITGVPDNVMVVRWMPQRDILAHPNCRLFITHGGSSSQLEAIYNGVPVIGVPHFADQHRNVELYIAKNVGLRILPDDISEETLSLAISTVLGNKMYRDNMKKLSQVFRDTPMTPKQTVLYWTEYILRHRGANHMMPSTVHLSWYQRYLLDTIALIALFLFGCYYFVYFSIKIVYLSISVKLK